MTTTTQPELLAIGDAARILGVSVTTLRRWEAAGRIRSERTLGGHRRYARDVLERARQGS